MNVRSAAKKVGLLASAAAGLAALLWAVAWLLRPDMSVRPPEYDEATLRRTAELRSMRIDRDNPPTVYREVDYAADPDAPWRPKGEPPLLAPLVAEGKLPPVAERVGEEPLVVEGVDGIGRYGGTWIRIGSSESDVAGVVSNRMSYATLVRWSPQGYPLVPHVAKRWEVSADNREFIFHLRRGMKWSDGHPFTADDIMYWWVHEATDPKMSADVPAIMKAAGLPGKVEKLDDFRVKFTFPAPNGLFIAKLATAAGEALLNSPAHYLRPYHPTLGDKDLIARTMAARRVPSPDSLYRTIKDFMNPEHPRLWPWVYRTYRPSPPQAFVRNPYYFMVDTRGNQLPYIDRVVFEVKSQDMITKSIADGDVSMQERHLRYDQYTLLMSMRRESGYEIYHWYPGDSSTFVVSVNLNRRVDPARPDTAKRRDLLNDKRFRQALSVAIRRRDVIEAEFNGQTRPAQNGPGPESFFYEPALISSYVQYDPALANRLLDELGLTKRDYEGYRTFPDGSRMTFYLNVSQGYISSTPGQFLVDDWKEVGLRVILRERSRALFYTEKAALEHDLNAWSGNGEFMPLLEPRYFLPFTPESNFAIAYAKWYSRGGLNGHPLSKGPGCLEPPPGHPLRRAMEIYERAAAESDPARQRDIFREALLLAAENLWTINISTSPPVLVVVKNGVRNVPRVAVSSWDFQTPGNAGMETYFFDEPRDSPGAIAQMRQSVLEATPPPNALVAADRSDAASWFREAAGYTVLALVAAGVVAASVRYPYVGRRVLLMVPTLLVISALSFTVIQLPPGDYLTTRIMQLQESGDTADLQQIDELKGLFHLDESMPMRYARWLGLVWFVTFDPKDAGLLQGHMGLSMENSRPVNEIVGDRILLTVLMSLGTILFTWAVAIPTGIYSAVRQYRLGDYILTFIGFIGMCVPSFLLALVLMFAAYKLFGIKVSGLFSSQFGAQPEWDWPKFVDLLKHLWIPVVVLGVGGTAGMIRVMRGNLLDELKKPYVVTARAKGVRPLRLLLKYPVRMALNPFISGIGALFPQLVSGGAIVSMVLSLPTVGPLMLSALMSEDMYLAGSMLMVLSFLGVIGTLVSDLLLLWLDPRIRFKGGTR